MAPPVNRRNFIKTTAIAGIGASIFSPNVLFGKDDRKARIGIIGTGLQGRLMLQSLLMQSDTEITALCDIDQQALAQAQDMVVQAGRKKPEGYSNGPHDYLNMVTRDDLDGILVATPWEWHQQMSVAVMKAGKYCGAECRGAFSLNECWELVRVSEETGMPCMLMENHNYKREIMAVLLMARDGLFGELIHAQCGYQHDLRRVKFRPGVEFGDKGENESVWRTNHSVGRNGDLYPTHGIGPISSIFDINRGNRFVTLTATATKARGLNAFVKEHGGADHPNAKVDFKLGDVVTTVIKCANGETVIINHDTNLPRPYSNMRRVQGTKGLWMEDNNSIYIEGRSEYGTWDPMLPYIEEYEHPVWKTFLREGVRGGHGGADFLKTRAFVQSVKRKIPTPIDVYDTATWLAITTLSEQSIAMGSEPVKFPDFTGGRWVTNKPIFGLTEDY
jgi:predicted dehydrogenase